MSSEPVITNPSGKTPARGPSRDTPPVLVVHRGGDCFDINVRSHDIRTDQPAADGGEDAGPTELFIASLAGCVAIYARCYLNRHDLPTEGLAVESDFNMGSRPAPVTRIEVRLTIPAGVPVQRRDALLAFASHCTVHNSPITTPEISVAFAGNPGSPERGGRL